jgi:hypothetical protein
MAVGWDAEQGSPVHLGTSPLTCDGPCADETDERVQDSGLGTEGKYQETRRSRISCLVHPRKQCTQRILFMEECPAGRTQPLQRFCQVLVS